MAHWQIEKVMQYKMAADRVLREHTGHDSDQSRTRRFPPFLFRGERNTLGNTINPYLVILAAEIKFRRYLAANGPKLPRVYESLMRKTIQVADLLYFHLPACRPAAFYELVKTDDDDDNDDFDDEENVFDDDEMDARTGTNDGSSDSTVRQTDTGGTRDGDPNYWRHMLSGRDLELNADDLDVLREIQESNRAASSHGQSLEMVDIWRRETAGKGSEA